MNITILANKDLASCVALNYLLPALGGHRFALVLSARVGGQATRPEALQRLAFFEQTLCNELLFPALDASSAAAAAELQTFQGLARRFDCSLQELNAINEDAELARFEATQPDLVLSIRYGVILKPKAIAIPRYGVLNLHSGILPDYKGVMATFHAMLRGETQIGTTLHYIDDAGIDTGRIVRIDRQALLPERDYLSNVLSLYEPGCQSLAEAVSAIERDGELSCSLQSGGSYYSFPTAKNLDDFSKREFSLVDTAEFARLARRFIPSP